MRPALYLLSCCFLLSSCIKMEWGRQQPVEVYLLQTHMAVAGKCQVDPATSVLQSTPLVANADIVRYAQKGFQLTLTPTGFEKIRSLPGRTPFAVTVDRQVVFFGYFMPSIMSSTCFESITMDLDASFANKVNFRLGYPWTDKNAVADLRNHPALLEALAGQHKLR